MEITVLGTSSIYAKGNCASLLIDKRILVDIGPGIIKYLIKNNYDLTKIDTIIFTHLHSDHILDFPTFVINVDERGVKHKINIYGPKGTKKKLLDLLHILYEDWFDEYIDRYFNFMDIEDGYEFKVNDYEFKAVEVKHLGIASFGFITNCGLGISGDTALCEGVEDIIKESKMVVTDCSFIEGNDYHMGLDNIEYLRAKYPKKEMILTHFRDNTRDKLKRRNMENVLLVEDGYSFRIGE